MKDALDKKIEELWKEALVSWNHPSIPTVFVAKTAEDVENFVGVDLENHTAFMELKGFQTYVNLENVIKHFGDDVERGLKAIFKHEQGHRFCPYDVITSMILLNSAKKGLEDASLTPYKKNSLANDAQMVFNLYTDMTVDTTLARKGDEDTPWMYKCALKGKINKKLWLVYGRSIELAWGKRILPEELALGQDEENAARSLAGLFKEDILDKSLWKNRVRQYARIIGPFLEEEHKKEMPLFDDIAKNIPKKIDKELLERLAKKLAKSGEGSGFDEFKDFAGTGKGDEKYASKIFYEMLAKTYEIKFATKPSARVKTSPFQPEKWQPSMGADRLDVDYSMQVAGRLIPGVTTYTWKHRKREQKAGLEDAILDVDIYLDASGSTQNPIDKLSMFVLTEIVLAQSAHKKKAMIRSTVFSGEGEFKTQEWTRDLNAIYENAVIHYAGGTVFPTQQLLRDTRPKHVIIITDTALDNKEETANALSEVLRRDKNNRVTVYAINKTAYTDYLEKAGADIVQGITTEIYKKIIGE